MKMYVTYFLGSLVVTIGAILLFGQYNISLLLGSSVCVLLLTDVKRALIWGTGAGLLYGTIAPYPPGIVVGSVLLVLILMHIAITNYVAPRSAGGAIISIALGSVLFESFLIAGTRLVDDGTGWTPGWDVRVLIIRTLLTTFFFGLFVLVVRRFSPEIRGIVISSR